MNIEIRKFYDSSHSYSYRSRINENIKEDEKGKYKENRIMREVPCSCHPETCNHFDGKKLIWYTEKIYIDNDTNR